MSNIHIYMKNNINNVGMCIKKITIEVKVMLKNLNGNTKNKLFKLLMCIIVILNVLLFFKIFDNHNIELYINWKIMFPKPSSVNNIYRFDFAEGEDFIIWEYENDKDVSKLIKRLHPIDDINKITNLLDEYYSHLDNINKQIFKENTNYEKLLNINNYYLYKNEYTSEVCFSNLLLIFVPEDNYLYIFQVVR